MAWQFIQKYFIHMCRYGYDVPPMQREDEEEGRCIYGKRRENFNCVIQNW